MGVRRTGAIGVSLLVLAALVGLGVTYSLPTAGKPSADALLWPSQDRGASSRIDSRGGPRRTYAPAPV
jgi:hypothetical protein